MNNLREIAKIFHLIDNEDEICIFLSELLTKSEIATLSKRWQILNLLKQGFTQREIVQKLNVSLCNVTRGAKLLKNKQAIVTKYLDGDKTNETNYEHKAAKQNRIFRKLWRAIH